MATKSAVCGRQHHSLKKKTFGERTFTASKQLFLSL